MLVIIGIVSGHNDKSDASSSSSVSPVPQAASPLTGKIRGSFHRDCFSCYDNPLVTNIVTSNAWCGWRDGSVFAHVRMSNNSIERVKVDWHPSYTLLGGSEHGAGIGSIQSDELESGETRVLGTDQNPKGAPANATISSCDLSFSDVQSG